MFWFIKSRAQRELNLYVRTRYDRIHPEPTQGLFNYQCHRNTINYVLQNAHLGLQVVECIYIDNGDPILHYLAFDPNHNLYLELTLGHFCNNYPEFYKIRTVDPSDYMIIEAEFDRAMRSWKNQFVHPLLRWAVDRVV
jgi:hypothetical protein